MGRPTTGEELCNLAFDLLRHNTTILSLTSPTTDEESLASKWYDLTRAAVLGSFPWEFAKKRRSIPLDLDGPDGSEYQNAYILPNDYIGLVYIGEDIDEDYELDYAIEGNRILIDNEDAASLDISYISDFSVVARFDPVFMQLLVGELAVVFANAITGLNKGVKEAKAFRDRWEAKARATNSRNTPIKVRYRGLLSDNRKKILGRIASSDGVHLFS